MINIRNTLCLAVALATLVAYGQDAGQISGYAFGDYYSASQHHDPAIKGMNGFWFRRIFLTYDKKIDKQFSTRFRLEGNSPGDFRSSTMITSIVRDAYVQYTNGNVKAYLGLIPTPTWENYDSILGFRPVERSPIDLYRMGEGRDFGISAKVTLDKEKETTAWLMVGNGSGLRGETDKGKVVYASLGSWVTPQLYVEGYADYWDKVGSRDWRTISGWAMYQQDKFRVALLGANQRRERPGESALDLSVVSLYADVKASKNVKPFFRVDFVNRPVPDADKILYMSLATNAKPTFYIAGVDFKVAENVHLIPNVEIVTYSDPVSGPTPKNDVFLRMTFFYIWK